MAKERKIVPLNRGRQSKDRFSISMDSDTKDKLKEEAEKDGMSLSELVEQASELELYIREETARGSKFYIKRPGEDETLQNIEL